MSVVTVVMPTLEEVYKVTDAISSATAFSEAESRLFYDLLCRLPSKSSVLEIGCEYGRSTSIIAQVGKVKDFRIHLIDDAIQRRGFASVMGMLCDIEVDFTLYRGKSQRVGPTVGSFELIHIDAGHGYDEVLSDCRRFMPLMSRNGVCCFHDYGRASLPDVKKAVDEYVSTVKAFVKSDNAETLQSFRRA